jgi:hypothetical protein
MFIPLPRPSHWVPQNNPGFMGCPGLTHKTWDPALWRGQSPGRV